MNIIEWNVGCASGNNEHGRQNLTYLFSEKPDCDILILTEFFRLGDYNEFEQQFRDWGYESFITPKQHRRNDVFIAVQKKHNPILQEIQIASEYLPDILNVQINIGDKKCAIMGVRFFGDYIDMKRQFMGFVPLITGYENIIIGGDFNNGKIYGSENEEYSERQIDCLYQYLTNGIVSKFAHFEYNYHRVKFLLAQNKVSLVTPNKGVSCKYKPPYSGGSKIDHFAVKGVRMCNVDYLPTHISDHNQLFGTALF